jgi:hypothetical protein
VPPTLCIVRACVTTASVERKRTETERDRETERSTQLELVFLRREFAQGPEGVCAGPVFGKFLSVFFSGLRGLLQLTDTQQAPETAEMSTIAVLLNSPPTDEDEAAPLLLYLRYFYPLALFFVFLILLTTWGIATSESSKPTPPPVNGIYKGRKDDQKKTSEHGTLKRIAARFPGGVPQRKVADARRLGALRKAVMNWLLTGVMVTLVGNAVNVIMHALTIQGWWCGKDYAVRIHPRFCRLFDSGKETHDQAFDRSFEQWLIWV